MRETGREQYIGRVLSWWYMFIDEHSLNDFLGHSVGLKNIMIRDVCRL
jgi:hypothetical protein